MKKFAMVFVCLMTMVMSVNAQRRYFTRSYGVRPHSGAYYYNHYSNVNNNLNKRRSCYNGVTTNKILSEDKNKTSFWDKQQMFSLGYTMGCVYGGDKTHVYYGLETIIGGALIGINLSDSDDEYGVSTGFQVGYFIPTCKFGKDDYRNGWNHALLISPLIEYHTIRVIDGEHMHNDPHHNCTWWVDKSYSKDGKLGFGVAIMYRFGCGNITAKVTSVSAGLTMGFGL